MHSKANENGDVIQQNLWDAAKIILRGKFIAKKKMYPRNSENSKIKTLYLKKMKKEEQMKLKTNTRKEITTIRAEINETET